MPDLVSLKLVYITIDLMQIHFVITNTRTLNLFQNVCEKIVQKGSNSRRQISKKMKLNLATTQTNGPWEVFTQSISFWLDDELVPKRHVEFLRVPSPSHEEKLCPEQPAIRVFEHWEE